jgi:RNA polymerase sigma factor (sigma-70 family)
MPVTPERLAQLLDAHAAALELFAAQLTRAAADVVQESFVELARQPVVPENVVAWLYRVVRNRASSEARSDRRRKRRESAVAANEAWFQTAGQGDLDPQDAADAIGGLSDELREVVVARIWGGLTFEQIAEITQTSVSTAFRRYEEAISILRTRLRIPCQNNKNSPKI